MLKTNIFTINYNIIVKELEKNTEINAKKYSLV